MTKINSIKLGVIVMCVAAVPLTLAQTPRIGTSGSEQPGATQTGTNARSGMNTGVNTNVGAHIGTNAAAQTGISNQAAGITGTAAGLRGWSGTSTGATQSGANARTGTNTTANTNAGAHTGTAAATPTNVTIFPRQFIPSRTPLGQNFSTAGGAPSPLPSASAPPTPLFFPANLSLRALPSAKISRRRGSPPRRYHRPRSPQLQLRLPISDR